MNAYMAYAEPGLFSAFVDNNEAGVNNTNTVFEIQDSKPAIDDVICHYLDGSTLKNALNFIDYVRASKMKIKWSAVNVWSVRYKNKHVLDIILAGDTWRVRLAYNHIIPESVFTNQEKENIKALIGSLRNSKSEEPELIPALS